MKVYQIVLCINCDLAFRERQHALKEHVILNHQVEGLKNEPYKIGDRDVEIKGKEGRL